MREVNDLEQQNRKPDVLLIIPAYNEAENLPRVVRDITSQRFPMDYIIVSDGSTDDTIALCEREGYHYIALPVNLGLSGCFQTGMKYAYRNGYQYAVQFDGDGQHQAVDIEPLYRKMKEDNYDIVHGSRFLERKKGGSLREIGSRMITGAIRMTTGKHITDPTCGLRMYNRRMMEHFANRKNYGPEPDTIAYLAKNGAKIGEAPVTIRERISGESYLKPVSAMKYMARMLVSILVIQQFRGNKI